MYILCRFGRCNQKYSEWPQRGRYSGQTNGRWVGRNYYWGCPDGRGRIPVKHGMANVFKRSVAIFRVCIQSISGRLLLNFQSRNLPYILWYVWLALFGNDISDAEVIFRPPEIGSQQRTTPINGDRLGRRLADLKCVWRGPAGWFANQSARRERSVWLVDFAKQCRERNTRMMTRINECVLADKVRYSILHCYMYIPLIRSLLIDSAP